MERNLGKENWVISGLREKVDPQNLRVKFDDHINKALQTNQVINPAFQETVIISGARLSKDRIQQEMYAKGYRRIKSPEEIDGLEQRYLSSQYININHDLKAKSQMFFAPVFPEKGEDNLIVIDKTNDFLNIKTYASKKQVRNMSDEFNANAKNSETAKPVINCVSFDDRKGMSNLIEAAGDFAKAKVRKVLNIKSAA